MASQLIQLLAENTFLDRCFLTCEQMFYNMGKVKGTDDHASITKHYNM